MTYFREVWNWFNCHFLDNAFGFEIDVESCAHSDLALHLDGASHLLHDFLANGEAKSRALLVHTWVFIQFPKINEKLFKALWVDTHTGVNHADAKVYVSLLRIFDVLRLFLFQMDFILTLLLSLWLHFLNRRLFILLHFHLLFEIELVNKLVIIHFYQNSNRAMFVREFKSIGQKVQKNLVVSALISQNFLNQTHMYEFINFNLQLNLFVVGLTKNDLKCFMNNHRQVEVLLVKFELIILKFRQVKKIVDKVFHHLLWKNLFL